MTEQMSAAVDQLRDELGARAFDLAGLLGVDLHEILTTRIRVAAPRLLAELDSGENAGIAATDILMVLWPHADPDLGWWRTPLGLALARSVVGRIVAGHAEDEGWTQAEAAEVLGVGRGTVAQLVSRGTLGRTSDGSCSRAAVLTRLVRLRTATPAKARS